MAEAVVSAVTEKLGSLLIEELFSVYGAVHVVHDQVEWMERELRAMQNLLKDADTKQRFDSEIHEWVREIREVSYDAEDIVDAYILIMHQQQKNNFMGIVKRYTCFIDELKVKYNTSAQIEMIKGRLQEISNRRTRYRLNANVGGSQEEPLAKKPLKERRELAILTDTNVFVGFEDDMERIVGVLLDEKKNERCVLSIVGMGGSGKTTLARRICNNVHVKLSFDGCCALVSVSKTYTVSKILRDIAKEVIDKDKLQGADDREIREDLCKYLDGNKYLIVLDDVWDTDMWGLIKPHLPDAKNGSRVIITTRFMNVAKLADPSTPPHELRQLRDDESWDLFTKNAFPTRDALRVCTGELKQLGETIVKTCGGLPLAIIVMGGLLSMKDKLPRVWRDVIQGLDWDSIPAGGVCIEILALSYQDLPQHLKPCFLYLSCFPENHEIDAEKLIHLWVAEGFIPRKNIGPLRGEGSRALEDIAEDWLEDLIQRSLLQVCKRNYSGRVVTCRIHDLLRDISMKEAKEVNFLHTCREVEGMSTEFTMRRFALHCAAARKGSCTLEVSFSAPKLRSFLLSGSDSIEGMPSFQFLNKLKLLRVLDLEDAGCLEIPKSIGELIHLRYLGMKNNNLKSIPPSVCKLHNLQTLDVRNNYQLKELPKGVWEIKMLRHILVDWRIVPPATVGSGCLVNLQTLNTPSAGVWLGSGLAKMTSLRSLGIDHILLAHNNDLANSLNSLLQLQNLHLEGEHYNRGRTPRGPLPRKALSLPNHRNLQELTVWGPLKNLDMNSPPTYSSRELPPYLTELALWDSELQQDPLSLLEKLPYLRCLRLKNAYMGQELACSVGSFPQLEKLELRWLAMKGWKVEDGAMPCLRQLEISNCHQLEMLPEGLQHIRTLQMLKMSCLSGNLARRLEVQGEDWYKIKHVPSIQIIP